MLMHPRLLASVLAVTLAVPVTASATWLQPHTRQDVIPQAEIQRPLVVGKSWAEATVGFSWKHSDSHWLGTETVNPGFTEGQQWEKERNDGTWDYRRFNIGMRWGFARNFEFNFRVPIVWAQVLNNRMTNEDGSPNPITSVGLGDIHTGVVAQLLRLKSPNGKISNSLVVGLDMRLPSGGESPGTYIAGPNNIVTIITGAGTWGFDLYARYRQHLSVLGIDVGVGYQLNPTNTVQYLLDTETAFFNRALDPGDVIHGDFKLAVQPVKQIAIQAGVTLDYRLATKWGHTVDTLPYCRECPEVPNSEGLYVDFVAKVMVDPTQHFGFDVYFDYTLAGRRNFLWPLEELSPSRGWTLGGDVSYRF